MEARRDSVERASVVHMKGTNLGIALQSPIENLRAQPRAACCCRQEPLALCISCRDQTAFDKAHLATGTAGRYCAYPLELPLQAVQYAETQLQKVHSDYKASICNKPGL